ncbi:transposase [Nonomuraea insulae]|uniref:Transposase n=1 Tax=Nonomuraea insulae TaxID=1616787 RepID=A0ABW1DD03_9ACTN
MSKKRRQYSPELRAEVASYVLDGNHTCAQAARAYNLVAETIRNWVNDEKKKRKGSTPEAQESVDRAQLAELERRVKELEAENSFLKKAAAYFAKEQG